MLLGMSTWKLAPAMVIVSLAGCGNTPSHTEAPPLPEPEEVEGAEPSDAEPAPSESDEGESEEGEPEEATSEEAEPSLPPLPAKKQCAGLPKSTCQVTEGCAWSTTDDCVDQ